MIGIIIGAVLGSLVVGGGIGYLIFHLVQKNRRGAAQMQASKIIEDAKSQANAYKKEAMLEAKEEVLKLKNETDNEVRERRAEIQRLENRLVQREESLDRKEEALDKKIQAADELKSQIEAGKQDLLNKEKELETKALNITKELERVAGLTQTEAKEQLVASIEDEARKEAGVIVRDIENQARDEGEKKAREIIT